MAAVVVVIIVVIVIIVAVAYVECFCVKWTISILFVVT